MNITVYILAIHINGNGVHIDKLYRFSVDFSHNRFRGLIVKRKQKVRKAFDDEIFIGLSEMPLVSDLKKTLNTKVS